MGIIQLPVYARLSAWKFVKSFGMLRRVHRQIITGVSKDRSAFLFGVKQFDKIDTAY